MGRTSHPLHPGIIYHTLPMAHPASLEQDEHVIQTSHRPYFHQTSPRSQSFYQTNPVRAGRHSLHLPLTKNYTSPYIILQATSLPLLLIKVKLQNSFPLRTPLPSVETSFPAPPPPLFPLPPPLPRPSIRPPFSSPLPLPSVGSPVSSPLPSLRSGLRLSPSPFGRRLTT